MTGERLKHRLLKLDKSMAAVARKLSITPQSLNQILGAADIKTGIIEQLSVAYNRPISYFFNEEEISIRNAGRDYVEDGKIEHKGTEYNGSTTTESDLRDQIAILKSQLEDKERIIKLMEERK